MPDNVILIGLMGAGKSVVGEKLASLLGRRFFDLDKLIEEREGMSVSEIFARRGEDHFRKVEAEMIREVAQEKAAVISCGGGALLRPENAERLKACGHLIYLRAGADELARRVGPLDGPEARARPLLHGGDPTLRLRELLSAREPLYLANADIVFDTEGLSPKEVAEDLVGLLKEKRWLGDSVGRMKASRSRRPAGAR